MVLFPHDQPIVLQGLSFMKYVYTVKHSGPDPSWDTIILLLAVRYTVRFILLMERN